MHYEPSFETCIRHDRYRVDGTAEDQTILKICVWHADLWCSWHDLRGTFHPSQRSKFTTLESSSTDVKVLTVSVLVSQIVTCDEPVLKHISYLE